LEDNEPIDWKIEPLVMENKGKDNGGKIHKKKWENGRAHHLTTHTPPHQPTSPHLLHHTSHFYNYPYCRQPREILLPDPYPNGYFHGCCLSGQEKWNQDLNQRREGPEDRRGLGCEGSYEEGKGKVVHTPAVLHLSIKLAL